MNIDMLKRKIDNCKIVSFDVFDTLVLRNVKSPFSVFDILEKELKRENIISENMLFSLDRKKAQSLAYDLGDEEVTISEIYKKMGEDYENVLDIIQKKEIDIELKVCQQNSEMKKVYDYCIEQGKMIIITTDMYLPREFFVSLLKKCNYSNYSKLYISSEIKKRKSTSNLFEYILLENEIEANEILHIGDNIKSDVFQARRKGINACHYNNTKEFNLDKTQTYRNLIEINKRSNNKSSYYKFGYESFGSSMFSFLLWLKERINNNKTVFFLSREGEYIKRSFEMLFGKSDKYRYLYLSRKSVRLPQLAEVYSVDNLYDCIELRYNATLKVLFDKCGLEREDYYEQMKKFGFDEWNVVSHTSKEKELIEILLPQIRNKGLYQKKKLKAYLEEKGYFDDDVILVDIGWKGTMQYTLESMFGTSTKGLYFGLLTSHYSVDCEGFIINRDIQLEAGMTLIETLFMPRHGSVIGYKDNNGEVNPVFNEPEFDDIDYDKIYNIQQGSMDFIMDYKDKYYDADHYSFECLSYSLLDISTNPKIKHTELLGVLPFYDSYKSTMISTKKRNVKSDFINSGWKVGFLKNKIKIKLPYVYIYYLLKKMVGA